MQKEERDKGEEERTNGRRRERQWKRKAKEEKRSSSYYKWQSLPGAMTRVCQHHALRFPQLLSQWEGQPATTW